jgi:hypothetical protein
MLYGRWDPAISRPSGKRILADDLDLVITDQDVDEHRLTADARQVHVLDQDVLRIDDLGDSGLSRNYRCQSGE